MPKDRWLDTAALAKELGFDKSQTDQLASNVSQWDKKLESITVGIRKCEVVSDSDLSVRINVRDSR